MPQDITTLTMPRIKIYSPADYPQKEYERFKALLESGKREQVITELRILYPKDSYLANLLANRLGIDLEKELGIIYHYQDIDSTTTAQITQDNTIEITTQYDNFHDTLQTIKNATQYRGNLADTLMAGVSGVFGAIDKGLEKLIKNTGDKRLKIAKYIFQSEGISISATYGYGSNDRDIIKTAVSVGLELAGGYFIGLALEGAIVSLGLASIPAFIVAGAISALIAGILMNTQAGKDLVNGITENLVKPLIDSIQSKLHSFFSLFDSNPSKYELVSNPSLESSDYKSLIELLLDSKSNALDIDSLLHTFPNYLAYLTHTTTDTTNSLSLSNATDSIPMCIKAQCLNHKNEPLANREIYVYSPNFASFVDKAKSDENGHITFNNACVSSKMTNSDLYFVLNRYGLDEEQKDYHIKISPSKTIQPNDKRARELTDQTLTFNKHIPKAIKANDSIMPNIKVNAIEFIEQNINNSTHIHLKAHYVLRDSQKKYIQGDEHTYTIHSIQKYKHKTKWGYIVFDKDEDIESTLREMTASKPLIKSVRFKELEGITGEIVSIPFKEEWQDKQIRFFAYLYKPHKDVGVDVEFEEVVDFVDESYCNKIIIKAKDDDSEILQVLYTPYHIDDPALQDMSVMFIPALSGLKIFSRLGGNAPKEPITRKKIEQRLDTLHNVKKLNLPRNKEAIYEVDSLRELRKLRDEFTNGTHRLSDKIEAKGIREEYIVRDHTNTIVQYRTYSNQRLSGGKPTIDIRTQTIYNGKQINVIHKIHIRYTKIQKEDGSFMRKIVERFLK